MIGQLPVEQEWKITAVEIERAYAVAIKVAEEMAKKQKQIAEEILSVLAVKSV
jgi:hypothetical protein